MESPSEQTVAAVVSRVGGPVDTPDALVDARVPRPRPRARDLIVKVEAVSVNPVDTKVRSSANPDGHDRILGYDAAGTVVETGPEVELFSVGDEVFYAGAIERAGTNMELHAVDERIVGRKPESLGWAEAAALPLTAITAWEALFDKFKFDEDSDGTLLIVGGAGGVGSIMIQLAKKLTRLRVLATAGRPESAEWVGSLGADATIDYHDGLAPAVLAAAPDGVDYVFSSQTAGKIADFVEVIKPFGEICAIDGAAELNMDDLKSKSLSWHWELMFTRARYETPDMVQQHKILNRVAWMVDAGDLRTTLTKTIAPFDAERLHEAHRLVESGETIGKIVLTLG